MKKYLLLSSALCLFALQAQAYGYGVEPYIGADLGASHIKTSGKDLTGSSNVAVFDINVGVKFNQNLGLEISSAASSDKDVDGIGDLSYSSLGIDAVGYIPLSYQLDILAMFGLGYYEFDLKAKNKVDKWDVHYTKNKAAFRGGLGLQYALNEQWALRGLLRYHHIDNNYFDYIGDATIGLQYKF